MRKVALELKGIGKQFSSPTGALDVLKNLSITVYRGEMVALVGPSGCGKTTLLNIIAGLVKEDEGKLVVNKERLAYVFQEPRLLPWKTVAENIKFAQDNFMSPGEGEQIRERLLKRIELLPFKDSYPVSLSGGMKQRVEFARALAVEPDVLLMDEPFKSLDVALKYQMEELLLDEHKRRGFTVLFATHDPAEAVALADRVIVLTAKPTHVLKEICVDIPRDKRSLGMPQLYEKYEEVLGFVRQNIAG